MARDDPEKQAVRALAALTGAPYQQCLHVLRVLEPLVGHLDLGELTAVVARELGARAVGIRVDDEDRRRLRHVLGALAVAAGDARLVDREVAETRLFIPVAHDGSQFRYELVLDAQLWPSGPWRFDAHTVVTALDHIIDRPGPAGIPTMIVRAERGVSGWPPDLDGKYTVAEIAAGAAPFPSRLLAVTSSLDAREPGSSDHRVVVPPPGRDDGWFGVDLTERDRLWMHVPPGA